MKFPLCLFALLIALLPVAAHAAPACYAPEHQKAEQLLRLHSELMVITVTCRQGSEGQDLVAAYSDFTKKNIIPLHNAEQTMVAYYKKSGGDALGKLDRLRTVLGNEYGQKAANMSAPAFCAAYRDKVLMLDSATPRDIDGEVSRMLVSERSYGKPCGDSARTPRVARR